ncbi:type II secretion system F family protein [Aquimonas sp.]|jgi:tight adherence protein B|uniref:type II secretion system F family protein n=1 Tax=Aquimonas sp. TaxID=1872588 RepID=UPI0037C080DA
MTLLISVGFAICCMLLGLLGVRAFRSAATDYQKVFTTSATASMRDLFLFIDPNALYRINLALIAFALLIVWAFSGLFVLALIVAVIAGFVPGVIFRVLKARRLQQFVTQLPEALQSMAGAMKAGASVVQAIEILVAETRGPISQEWGLFLREVRVGVSYEDALASLLGRVPSEELRLVVAGMRISREIGGNLAETLERLADTLRRKLEMEGKIRALTAQGRMQGMVMTLLPIFLGGVLYYMEPTHMGRMFTEVFGWITVSVVIIVLSVGYFFIRKIVNIDV